MRRLMIVSPILMWSVIVLMGTSGCEVVRVREVGHETVTVEKTPGSASVEVAARVEGGTGLEVTAQEVRLVAKTEKTRRDIKWWKSSDSHTFTVIVLMGFGYPIGVFINPIASPDYGKPDVLLSYVGRNPKVEVVPGYSRSEFERFTFDSPYPRGLCFLPFVWCVAPPSYSVLDYTETEEQVRRKWTETERSPKAGRMVVEALGGPIEVRTDSSGHATVSLVPVALAALQAGQDHVRLRVRFADNKP